MPKPCQKSDRPLRCLPTVAYSVFRVPLSTFDFTLRPARTVVWGDKLGMPPGTQAMAIAAAEPAVECEAHYAFAALLGPRLGRWREARASLERGQAAWAHATSGAWASVHIEEPDDYPLGPRDEEEEEEEGS